MTAEITSLALSEAAKAVAAAAEGFAGELNGADGALGDGDLGITVSRGFLEALNAVLPADVGQAFLEWSRAFQRVSSSSYGTLVATAFLSAAKATKGRERVPASEIPAILRGALDAMTARGKGSLGDKTVLDSLDAIIKALDGAGAGDMLPRAADAARETVETFRARPNLLGRARMFGTGSVGLVDPGQLALCRIVEALEQDGGRRGVNG